MRTTSIVGLSGLLILLVAAAVFYFRDTTGPQIALTPGAGPVSAQRHLQLQVEDPGSGLKSLGVTLVQQGKSIPLLARTYERGTLVQSESLSLPKGEIKDGPVEINVTATDRSIFPFGAGNVSQQVFTFEFDSRAPVISVLSTAHNLNRGGAGLIVYTLSEEAESTGVTIGELFFPGYRQPSGAYACLFAFPWNMTMNQFTPKLMAVDRAGNERQAGFYYHLNNRNFRERKIEVGQSFLETKAPEFEELAPQAQSPLDAFLQVNREVREQNRQKLIEIGASTAPVPLWEGAFLRQSKAATLALFADHRSYYHEGQEVDKQTHLGIDLASVAQAPVEAANSGTVVFADYLGIYGLCVIIDHGMGLQSLYGHLSRIAVQQGEQVSKGQIVGNTGATGMAGGDHLHFEVLLGGLSVYPLEWWDGDWITNNVTSKLQLAPGK
ncbi:peptidase M24 [Desulfuromonas versatilis]|uniref:Peptidase M24 n=1 Tax=Desulfuromonas versatilis TaxID=2802975 RepID=A0ABN6DTJ7_9BACT|nr:M23 family metallopeptidase [Desulfuromonas versatilis]BCR03336.1 peptidase M24 [Desulfuromonas versatilis]